ncbi:hypothetical protein HYW17_05185 [Candidatus Uhrbacteria bacterium]|nr:hypothetical protein [Candidatus Uhrbacteria bacterium]
MTAREKLFEYLKTFPNAIIAQPVITNIDFTPFDFSRGTIQDPTALALITDAFLEVLEVSKFDLLAALPISGVSITTALSLRTKKPFVIVREDQKRPGRPRIMGSHNFLKPGMSVLMVDDWIASGKNKHGGLKLLEDAGAKVEAIACLGDFDMEESERGPMHELQERGIKIVTLIKWSELCRLQHEGGVMDDEFYALSVARLKTGAFSNDSQGNLTRSAAYLRKRGVKIEPALKEFFQKHGVDVSGL